MVVQTSNQHFGQIYNKRRTEEAAPCAYVSPRTSSSKWPKQRGNLLKPDVHVHAGEPQLCHAMQRRGELDIVVRVVVRVGAPEHGNRSSHRIASTNQHRMGMVPKWSTPHGAYGVAQSATMPQRWSDMMSKSLYMSSSGIATHLPSSPAAAYST